MNKFILTFAALTLVSPALAQAPTNEEQRNACPPASQQTAEENEACLEHWAARSYDETRGDFGDDERPFSLSEKDWNGE